MSGSAFSRRGFLTSAGLLGGAALAGTPLLTACNNAASQANQSAAGGGGAQAGISMQLGWLLDNGQIGEALAHGKGWFKDNRINFSINPRGPSMHVAFLGAR